MGRTMAVTRMNALRIALRRRYTTQLALATWRGYANLVLYMTKYVGTWTSGHNKAHVRQDMLVRANVGEFVGMWMAHETDEPTRDAFISQWMGGHWGGCSRLGLDMSVPNLVTQLGHCALQL